MKLGSIEKDKQPSQEITRLFEKTRVAYLSAKTDPKEYGGRWRKVVDLIIESYNELDSAGKELNNFIDEEDLMDKDTKDPSSNRATDLYEKIKLVRYSSKIVADPFADMFKGSVLEELLSNPESMVKFVHYALRNDNKALSPEILSIKDMEIDSITEGLMGLDLESEDIGLYIIEHYGDGKDSKKVESKVKAAMDMLELIYFSQHEDQEKYDGMRVQLKKLDDKVTIYSYNEKDITDKCPNQVKELKKKEYGDCILDAELILFKGEESLHRADTVAHVFKGKYKDANLRCHVFDIIRHEAQTMTDEELSARMIILFNNYSSKSSDAIAFPSKKDTREADTLKDIERYAKEMMNIPTSEGVVIKDATSTYYIGTKKNPKWIKWKKFVDLDVMVLTKKKTKSGLYSYGLGIGPISEELDNLVEIKGNNYMNVGKALNTKVSVDVGDIIRVKVDEVKKKGEVYSLYSAKVIEVPEVDYPDKLVTLELLSKDTKKSLNYDVEALTKGIKITDYIHGETNLIIKSDMDGFTIYGFEQDNLMSKNALADLDMWKQQAIDIMKSKQSELTVAIFQFLRLQGASTVKRLHNHLKEKQPSLYEDVLESKETDLKQWAGLREGITIQEDKLIADEDKIMQEEIKKEYKTPEELLEGQFKLYAREDENVTLAINLGKESMFWTIELDDEKELFDLFGAAGKYPAEVSKNIERGKVIDSGKIKLGVQKDGYHEYFLEGNKFETKMHFRVIEVKGIEMWLAWTGFKQEPADEDSDEGKWDIYADKHNKLPLPNKN